jgi:hypothetical protein
MNEKKAVKTRYESSDDLTVYDLDPNASELWVVAGPDGHDACTIDPDNLPDGFRWITDQEWEDIQDAYDSRYGQGCD